MPFQTFKPNKQIHTYVNSLLSVYQNANCSSELLDLKLMELLYLIRLQDGGSVFLSSLAFPNLSKKRRNIKVFMQNNYSKNLNVQDYALLTGRSISTFIREFKITYNTTPKKWLISQRLKKSHLLLKHANYSVTEAAIEVGYENVSHFIKAYKIRYGYTPIVSKNN